MFHGVEPTVVSQVPLSTAMAASKAHQNSSTDIQEIPFYVGLTMDDGIVNQANDFIMVTEFCQVKGPEILVSMSGL